MAPANAIPDFTQFSLLWSECVRKGEIMPVWWVFYKGLVKELVFWTEWEGVWVFACYFAFTENIEDYLHVCAQWEKMAN